MSSHLMRAASTVALLLAAASSAGAQYLPRTPYLQFSDSPFATLGPWAYFHLETFEDGLLNTPGVTALGGALLGPGGLTDAVDGDDGVLDNSGNGGTSHFATNAFEFSAAALGALPTHVGIVWTDGADGTGFRAVDAFGVVLGTVFVDHADAGFFGTTAEDRFYGLIHADGISRIEFFGGTIESDHLQYGRLAAPTAVPEPGTWALLATGLAGIGAFARRGRRARHPEGRRDA